MGIFGLVYRFRYCYLWAFAFSVIASPAYAVRTVTPAPGDIQRAYNPGTGSTAFTDARNWDATVSVQNGSSTGSTSVNVTNTNGHGYGKFRNGLKNMVKATPAGAAQTAAIAGALAALDWLFDPANNRFHKEITAPPPPNGSFPSDQGYVEWEMAGQRGGSPDDAWQKVQLGVAYYNGECELLTATTARCASRVVQGGNVVGWQNGGLVNQSGSCPGGYTRQPSGCYITSYEPVTDTEIDNWGDSIIDPNFAAEVAPSIAEYSPSVWDNPDTSEFTGPSSVTGTETTTTSTNPTTGDITVTTSSPVYNFDYSTNPLSVTSTTTNTSNTYENGNLTNTTTTTTNEGDTVVNTAPAPEVPTDCAFMPTVCEFIAWVKTPFTEPDPDLSELIDNDQDFERSVSFSSNATCPSPLVFDTSLGRFDFSFEPACLWMGYMKPLIIIAALIAAVFISLGTARGGD